jgi:hypothetical protein
MTALTREGIAELLRTNDKAVCRALVVLYNNQTADEQSSETTNQHNGRGFAGFDAEFGTRLAKFYLRNGYLTAKQIAPWRKINSRGTMKIAMYWKQLIAAAQEKQVTQAAQIAQVIDTSFSFGANAK